MKPRKIIETGIRLGPSLVKNEYTKYIRMTRFIFNNDYHQLFWMLPFAFSDRAFDRFRTAT